MNQRNSQQHSVSDDMRTTISPKNNRGAVVGLDKQSKSYGLKHLGVYIKENPHMAVSVSLFCCGGIALWQNVTPLAGSLFGAGGALLGAWITELNKRRTD